MIRYVLDTDHVTLHFRGHSQLGQKLALIPPDEIATTTITAEEQLRGRLAQMKKASTTEALPMAHRRFRQAIYDLAKLNILELDSAAITIESISDRLPVCKSKTGPSDIPIRHQSAFPTKTKNMGGSQCC